MTEADTAALAALPGLAFAFTILLARTGTAIMLLPGLGETELPPTMRAGFALALTVVLLPSLLDGMPPMPASVPALGAMVAAEVATGLWLGWLARMIANALPIAGQFISYLLGLSSVLQPDAALGPQNPALGRLFGLLAPVLVLGTGLHALPLAALAGSYRLIPPGSLLPAGDAAEAAVLAVSQAFGLALRLASPFVLAGIAWQIALALVARLVPRLQIYFVAVPGQILGGLALLGMLSAALLGAWREAAQEGFARLPGL